MALPFSGVPPGKLSPDSDDQAAQAANGVADLLPGPIHIQEDSRPERCDVADAVAATQYDADFCVEPFHRTTRAAFVEVSQNAVPVIFQGRDERFPIQLRRTCV